MPTEETFLVPLKYIDVKRSTHTDLDVAQEKRLDYYWNVDEDTSLSDSWDRFHEIHSIERDTSKRIFVVREETDKKIKRLHVQIMYGLKRGSQARESRSKKRRSRVGKPSNRNLTMPEV